MARLQRILIATERGAPLRDLASVEVVAGHGLAGDRYWAGTGTFSGRAAVWPGARELSLIDAAAVACCNARLAARSRASVDAADLRRNLVIDGLEPALSVFRLRGPSPGTHLRIGDVVLEVLSTCPPCGYLSRLLRVDARAILKGLGGVRARVVVPGRIAVADRVDYLCPRKLSSDPI